MYKELGTFLSQVGRQRSFWKDGEFWTAVVAFGASTSYLNSEPEFISKIQAHLGDALTVVSIIFGFALTTATFYIAAVAGWSADPSSAWRNDERVRSVSQKLVDWNIWTILTLMLLIAYLIVVWAVDQWPPHDSSLPRVLLYSGAIFFVTYAMGQVLNHALTLSWFHSRIRRFAEPNSNQSN